MVKDQDLNQMRHVFNSIDVDNDGHLSLSEMRKFAREVRYKGTELLETLRALIKWLKLKHLLNYVINHFIVFKS